MKIWMTYKCADSIREVETNHKVTAGHRWISYNFLGGRIVLNDVLHGRDWHLSKKEAAACQMRYRQERIFEAVQEAARLQSLPALVA